MPAVLYIEQLQRQLPGGGIDGVVIRVFQRGLNLIPVVLSVVHIAAQHLFHRPVRSFCLSIGLRVMR
jgi:hypothetical protein